jgi:hypothetical protein
VNSHSRPGCCEGAGMTILSSGSFKEGGRHFNIVLYYCKILLYNDIRVSRVGFVIFTEILC